MLEVYNLSFAEPTYRGWLKHQGKSGEIPALSRNGESPNACLQIDEHQHPSRQRVE